MIKTLAIAFISALSISAFADNTVKVDSDTSKNPLTGNTTTTEEIHVKDSAGHELANKETKIKKNKKGQRIKKSVTTESKDSQGNLESKSKSETNYPASNN